MKYASIDLETTGVDPEHCQILQIGVVIDDTEHPEVPVEDLPTLNLIINRDRIVGEPFALAMNEWLLNIIADRAEIPEDTELLFPGEAKHRLVRFLRDELGSYSLTRHYAAGKCFDTFDRLFLTRFLGLDVFHRRSFDPTTMFMYPADTEPPALSTCLERAGVEPDVLRFHDAVYDAQMVIKCLRRGWKCKT